MTTIDTHPDGAAAATTSSPSGVERFFVGAAAWATTTDHKRIGRLYLGAGLVLLLAVAVVGLLLGFERADDGNTIVDADALLQLFQVYRVGLAFAVLVPLSLGLAVAVTPLQLGARSIAFPRLALTGFYAWLGGLSLTMAALARNGGMGGGNAAMVDLFLAGIGLMILGLLATAGAVATSVLTTRAPGMTMRRVPLFAWSTLVSALGLLLVLPVAFGAVIFLFVDHRLGIGANFGGVEGIGPWLGWVLTVPAVVVAAIPAVGVAAELIPVSFRHRQVARGLSFAGMALIGVAAYSAATQQFVHDVTFDTDGETFLRGAVPYLIFSGLPLLGVTVVLLAGLVTIRSGVTGGRPSIRAPFVFGLFGLLVVGAGIAANALQGITDLELIGTSFEEGATLLVVYGTLLGVLGGVVFWAPKLWGRVLADAKVLPLALLGLVGTLLAAAPLLVAGFVDQVGGIPSSDAEVGAMLATGDVDGGALWNSLSAIGHGIVALTVLALLGLMLSTFTGGGDDADDDPYGGHTVEWGTSSPAPATNYEHVVTVASAEPNFDTSDEGSPS